MFSRNLFYIAVIFSLVICAVPAHASCGAASCPYDTASWDKTQEGEVRLGYRFEYAEQDQHRIGTRKAAFGEIPGHHDEEFTVNRIHRIDASVGLTDWLGIDFSLPVISRSHSHIHHHQGEDILESWDISGVGDFSLVTRSTFFRPANAHLPSVTLLLGAELPTGKHHLANDDGDEAEAGIQPGSGSLDGILGLSTLQKFSVPMLKGGYGTLPFFTSVVGQFNGAGNDEYRLGDTLQVNVGTAYPLTPQIGFLAQLNFLLKDRDAPGTTREEIQKTGGETLYFSPGMEFRPTEDWRAFALIQIPVYQRVNSIQTTSDYNVLMGISYRFNFPKAKK